MVVIDLVPLNFGNEDTSSRFDEDNKNFIGMMRKNMK